MKDSIRGFYTTPCAPASFASSYDRRISLRRTLLTLRRQFVWSPAVHVERGRRFMSDSRTAWRPEHLLDGGAQISALSLLNSQLEAGVGNGAERAEPLLANTSLATDNLRWHCNNIVTQQCGLFLNAPESQGRLPMVSSHEQVGRMWLKNIKHAGGVTQEAS